MRGYTGDDPIAPWENYIRWTEQTFPRGGKESNMRLLLERCVQQFKDEARYKNDPRYVSAWLKLVSPNVMIIMISYDVGKASRILYSLA